MSDISTDSGIPIKPVYRAEDAGAPPPDPGQYPYTRGVYPTMYRGRLWTMRQFAGFGTPRQTNERIEQLLQLIVLCPRFGGGPADDRAQRGQDLQFVSAAPILVQASLDVGVERLRHRIDLCIPEEPRHAEAMQH
jgi:hypothetical protein